MSYNADYPKTAPAWLRLLPTPAELPRLYPRQLQALALKALQHGEQFIQWNDTSLTFSGAGCRLTKTLQENGRLKTQCTCNWKHNDRCPHDFMAYHILRQIAAKEGWTFPGESPFLVKLTKPATTAPAVVLPPPASERLEKTATSAQGPVKPPRITDEEKPSVPPESLRTSDDDGAFFTQKPQLVTLKKTTPATPPAVLPTPAKSAQALPRTPSPAPLPAVPKKSGTASRPNAAFFAEKQPVTEPATTAPTVQQPPAPSALLAGLSANDGAIPVGLTVEADFHLHDTQVGLRFYMTQKKTDATRQLMILSSVWNRASDLHSGRKFQAYEWNEDDADFLRFIYPELAAKRKNINILRSNTLMISSEKFQEWRRKFASCIGRFINRDDQKPLPPIGQSAPVGLAFQLTDSGTDPERQCGQSIVPPGYFRIQAQIIFPNGLRKYVWQVLEEIADDPNAMVSRAELFQTELPVKWPMLQKYFNRKLSTIRKENAVKLLPQLLCQHLELLEDGPCVKRQNSNKKETISPVIQFSLQDNAFHIRCMAAGQPVHINSDDVLLTKRLRIDKFGHLVIAVATAASTITTALSVMRELAKNPNATASPTDITFPECLNSAIFLAQAWRNIPQALEKTTDPELNGIFAANGVKPTLQPLLQMYDRTAFVHFEVEWIDASSGITISRRELNSAIDNWSTVIQDTKGRWLAIDPERAEAQRQQLVDEGILDADGSGAALLRRSARETVLKLTKNKAVTLETNDDQSRLFANQLLTEPAPVLPPLPPCLDTLLRDYQKQGVTFLVDRALCRAGTILADDMGLGKTLQTLAMLALWKSASLSRNDTFNALIICPATVIGVWCAQAKEYCPDLDVVPLTGTAAKRQKIYDEHPGSILVTHYGLVRADNLMLKQREYDFIILDEAQNIKNPNAQATLAVKSLDSRHRIALTGTPLENRLQDLWSIMDFLNPGFLGDLASFNETYASGGGNIPALVHRLAPLMLRREKAAVATELPPRTVTILPVEMADGQRELYERELVLTRNNVNEEGGAFEILAALTRLRQICCDPELKLKARHDYGSGKLELLLEKCADLLESGHSILVFSQFAQMLDIIQREMTARNMPTRLITGDTPVEERARLVDDFNEDPKESVMLLSLKAAGTGLTLTRADYVFLYDPWWNPAAENQAIDRTHRIGQTRPVFAYRMVAEDSIEGRVLELMQRKKELFDAVIGGATEQTIIEKLDRSDLLRLLDK